MSRKTVLVVDDQSFIRKVIRAFLEDNGFEVVDTDTGDKALSMLDAEPTRFSAVLLDRRMPGKDGLTVLRTLRADSRFTQLPVVIQTVAASDDHMREGIEAGAHHYLIKPFDESSLLDSIRSALGGVPPASL